MAVPARFLSLLSLTVLAGAGYFGTVALLRQAEAGNAASPETSAQTAAVTTKLATRDEAPAVASAEEWLARFNSDPAAPNPGRLRILGNWSDEELRRALDAAIPDPQAILPSGIMAGCFTTLAGEWLKRDPAAFTRWLDALPDEGKRNMAARYALNIWPDEQSEAWVGFLHSHPELRWEDQALYSAWRVGRAETSAASRGALELAECMKKITDLSAPLAGTEVQLPRGFDYDAFLKTDIGQEVWSGSQGSFLIQGLMREDRDRAFDLVAGNAQEFSGYESQLLHPAAPSGDGNGYVATTPPATPPDRSEDREQASWLGEKVSGLDEDGQARLIPMLIAGMDDPTQVGNFIDGLSEPGAQDAARRRAVEKIGSFGVEGVMPYLEGIDSPEERLSLLEKMPVRIQVSIDSQGNRISSPNDLNTELLSSKLTEWGATTEQTSTILNHVQNGWMP